MTPEQNPDLQRQFYRREARTPPQLKLCLGKKQINRPSGRYIMGANVFQRHGFVLDGFVKMATLIMLCFSSNKALAAEGFLLVFYRIAFVDQDFARGSSVAADLPRLA